MLITYNKLVSKVFKLYKLQKGRTFSLGLKKVATDILCVLILLFFHKNWIKLCLSPKREIGEEARVVKRHFFVQILDKKKYSTLFYKIKFILSYTYLHLWVDYQTFKFNLWHFKNIFLFIFLVQKLKNLSHNTKVLFLKTFGDKFAIRMFMICKWFPHIPQRNKAKQKCLWASKANS